MKAIKSLTWVQDASAQFTATAPFEQEPARTDTHVFDVVLHVYVIYDDDSSAEWSVDWGTPMPEWAKDAIDAAIGVRIAQ